MIAAAAADNQDFIRPILAAAFLAMANRRLGG